ncbi:MAG: formylglycine-generating enzyme family protein, partial [Pseudorhodoplanes sp.]
PNPWGLYQVHGNVWEWTADCWNGSYSGAPSDGSAWTAGDCSLRVVRGGSWVKVPGVLRSGLRGRGTAVGRDDDIGFRVARTLVTP